MEWDAALSVGVEQIDVEHRQILRRARQLEIAVKEGRPEEIRGALKVLDACLHDQFASEEGWMAEAGYPGAAEHGRIHAGILDDVAAARHGSLPSPAALAGAAADLVAKLERHMCIDDLKLGRFHTARENLRLLAEAGPGVGAALTPIPGMLAPYRAAGPQRSEPAPPPKKRSGTGE
jgi:hemerythrin-like metal-binding protein